MSPREDRTLLTVVLACAAVTLFHHAHNAEFLADYPSMPVSVTPARVYAAWLCATVVGIAGYVLVTRSHRVAGLALLVAYGAYGLAGLVHYLLAPASAHTIAMNMSIAGEAVAATALLVVLFRRFASSGRPSP